MSTADVTDLALVAVIAVAPLALVLLAAIFRGYTISLHMTREDRERRRRHGEE